MECETENMRKMKRDELEQRGMRKAEGRKDRERDRQNSLKLLECS